MNDNCAKSCGFIIKKGLFFVIVLHFSFLCHFSVSGRNAGLIDVFTWRQYSFDFSLPSGDDTTHIPDNVIDTITCLGTPPATAWGIREDWHSEQTDVSTYVAPVVGDVDGDGIPEIFVAKNVDYFISNGIYIFHGNNRNAPTLINTVNFSNDVVSNLALAQLPIGGSNKYIIVVMGYTDGKLYAYDANSSSNSPLWISNQKVYVNYTASTSTISYALSHNFADFDNDSIPEIYVAGRIFDAVTGIMLAEVPDGGNVGIKYWESFCKLFTVAADVIGDAKLELLAGTQVYQVNIVSHTNPSLNSLTLAASIPDVVINSTLTIKDGNTVTADIDRDGFLDVIASAGSAHYSGGSGIIVWDPRTQQLISKGLIPVTNNARGSIPFVGNIDNNPDLEIAQITPNKLTALRHNASTNTLDIIYSVNVTDASGATGITLFDFNQDGQSELVYRDETNLRILQPAISGSFVNINTFPAYSGTSNEYPVVVDVDDDGEAEIVVVGNTSSLSYQGTLRIYKSNGSSWASARKVWNQYAYNVVNVNEDLTVPQYQFNPATWFAGSDHSLGTADDIQPFNNFLQQQTLLNQYGEPLWIIPEGSDTLAAEICAGDSYNFYGRPLTVAGTYIDTVPTLNGCDSIHVLLLSFLPQDTTCFTDTICNGEVYTLNGFYADTSGSYARILPSQNGCDSIVLLQLTVMPTNYNSIADLCAGDSILFAGVYYSSAGIYMDTLLSSRGCDSIVALTITIHPHEQSHFDDEVCTGKRYRKHGFDIAPHDSAGIYSYERQLQTIYGCDSLVTLILQVPEIEVEINSSNPDFCTTYETILTAITPNSNIYWNTGATTHEITVTRPGIYQVFVSEYNCEISAHFTIEPCPVLVIFPNAITPNNYDGINQYFYLPAADDVLELSIDIYNRWGNCIFSSFDPHFRWDGTINGKIMQGVYVYHCILRTLDKKQRSISGIITVL